MGVYEDKCVKHFGQVSILSDAYSVDTNKKPPFIRWFLLTSLNESCETRFLSASSIGFNGISLRRLINCLICLW